LEPEKSPAVSDTAMKLKDEELAKSAAAKAEMEKKAQLDAKAKDKRAAEEKERLDELRARLRADARRQELTGKLKGGREALGGNQLSKGYATSGGIATDADEYVGMLRAHVHRNWDVPSWMRASALKAVMLVKINADGSVKEKSFLRKSGNLSFDATVESAIEKANPFPAPPRGLARMYMEDGFECGFPN
jgi:TolA protein